MHACSESAIVGAQVWIHLQFCLRTPFERSKTLPFVLSGEGIAQLGEIASYVVYISVGKL